VAEVAESAVGFDGFLELAHFADGAQPRELLGAVEHRYAGRVVAAILQAFESLDEDWDDVALSDGSDYSAHASVYREVVRYDRPEVG
jgi:hypothetical protein